MSELVVFQSKRKMNDFNAPDMRCADLSENQLINIFGISDVSERVDPYKLNLYERNIPVFSPFSLNSTTEKHISKRECEQILFNEFRSLSGVFSFYGQYKWLIVEMINRMQQNKGGIFTSDKLDLALKEQLLSDKTDNSTLKNIYDAIRSNIDWKSNSLSASFLNSISTGIKTSILPKFDRFEDNFNGMGITIHDTWATVITISDLVVSNGRFNLKVHYKVQDHFGLDDEDIMKWKFKQFRMFRIWFFLQRFSKFGFKPFINEMNTTIELNGGNV